MIYSAVAKTDIGTKRRINQDSLLIRHLVKGSSEILLSVVCDGMGGLSSGEVASATVINRLSNWFDEEIIAKCETNIRVICDKLVLLLREINSDLINYGAKRNIKLGTTFTGLLFIGNQLLLVHIGDTRLYHLGKEIKQITKDHTYIAKALALGEITEEKAKTDKRRNALTQCIGASSHIEPQVVIGNSFTGGYLLCSDGFRHKISSTDIYKELCPSKQTSEETIRQNLQKLIEENKLLGETDNISAIYILRKKDSVIQSNRLDKINLSKRMIFSIGLFLLSILMMIIGIIVLCI